MKKKRQQQKPEQKVSKLEKELAKKTRQLEIEASLEKVRAVAMSMHKSDDLISICEVSYKEFQKLGFKYIRNAIIHVPNDEHKYFMDYDYSDLTGGAITKIEYGSHQIVDAYLKKIRSAADAYFEVVIDKSQLKGWKDFRRKSGQKDDPRLNKATALYYYLFSIGIGDIGISTLKPIDESQIKILKRFRNVFDLAYRRYNDIALAEEQSKEMRIQLSLERVRARTMAMHKSEELSETSFVLFKQLKELGEVAEQISILIYNEKEKVIELYATIYGNKWEETGRLPFEESSVHKKIYAAWKEKKKSLIVDLKGKELNDFNNFKMKYSKQYKSEAELPKNRWVVHNAFFSKGVLTFSTHEPRPSETLKLLERFASVFDLTYTRFLDLQKAEAQAREAQIEVALERVRARTMAMQKSDELRGASLVLFQQMKELGEPAEQLTIGIVNEAENIVEVSATLHGDVLDSTFGHSIDEPQMMQKIYKAWKTKKKTLEVKLHGVELKKYNQYRNSLVGTDVFPTNIDPNFYRISYMAFFSKGFLALSTNEPRPAESIKILERFSKAFNLTYTRFLDLQKAETQARESRIQLALERVRARTMAMHESIELAETAAVLFRQLIELGIEPNRLYIGIIKDEIGNAEFWVTNEDGGKVCAKFSANVNENLSFEKMFNGWMEKKESIIIDMQGKELQEYIKQLRNINVPFKGGLSQKRRVQSIAYFSHGFIGIASTDLQPEETINLLKKFATVFNLTYQRFLDLQKAEAQARESQIQLGLERVRAKAAAMHKSDELLDVIGIISEQLQQLGFHFDHVSFAENNQAHDYRFWLSVLNQPRPYYIAVPYIDNPMFERAKEAQQKGLSFYSDVLTPEENRHWHKHVFDHNDLDFVSKERKEYIFSKGFARSIAFLPNIMLIIGNYSSTPYSKSENNIINRFATVFQQSYTRFLDLKKAEAQAREAQIETALERIRSLALGMHQSEKVGNVTDSLFAELNKLSVNIVGCSIVVIDEEKDIMELWRARSNVAVKAFESSSFTRSMKILKKNLPEWFTDYFEALRRRKNNLINEFESKERSQFLSAIAEEYNYSVEEKAKLLEIMPQKIVVHFIFSKLGYLALISEKKLSNENLSVAKRFIEVFDFAYIRFLDIKKAEEQTREAQIENALEKVRSRSLAMHKSIELKEVVTVLFERLRELSITMDTANIEIYRNDFRNYEMWVANSNYTYPEPFYYEYFDDLVNNEIVHHKQIAQISGEEIFTRVYPSEIKNKYWKYLFKHTMFGTLPDERKNLILKANSWSLSCVYTKHSGIVLMNYNDILHSNEELNILKRFSRVFEQAYIRFRDLQKAEEQAREAEIEAALERVRSRTMAMQKSNELAETASHLFDQLNGLGIKPYRFNIAIVDTESDKCRLWSTTNEGKVIPTGPSIPLKEHSVIYQMYNGWKQQQRVTIIRVQGDERIEWTKYIMRYVSFNEYKPENIDLEKLRNEPAIFSNFFFKQGFIVVHTTEEIIETEIKIIQRFVNVFEQTYTRFLDLKKAEAQAREAQIEAALERVRAKAMAMHSSDDISDTVGIVFTELPKLSIKSLRCGVVLFSKDSYKGVFYAAATTNESDSHIVIGEGDMSIHPIFMNQRESWIRNENYFVTLSDRDLKSYYKEIFRRSSIPYTPKEHKTQTEHGYYFSFTDGMFYAWAEESYSEGDINILNRFKTIIDLTFRRYFDLKKAETQAKEAIKQASLDRIRGEIASMRTSEDLNRITPVIWRELKNLDVPFFRCGVYIVDEKTESVHVYLTTPDGKSLGVLNLSFNSNEITSSTVEHWKTKQIFKTHWDRQEFIKWTKSMVEIGQVQNAETYQGSAEPPESLYLHFVPFAQGMLYVGDVQHLTDEKLELVKTLAEAFSIAYARYEDFKNLEDAKNKIEITLNELKAAQAQLVHSEKMASLGELTAGIAHEIKNPLNFVNNFSEVSRELLDEMKAEIENKNIDEVIELIEDLKQNLDKINQHGKRADSIVKGMLLHSRGTSGEKTLTDINDLLDQYVNLAYHGMRAQNKEFNITIEKDYDDSIEKINVVPQDISRVFLNIINNACYAAFDKKKKGNNNFSPTLRVSTKKFNNKVEIKIADNGNGIPSEHLDKIFQPFFTTKPSGEGTGLGLSLSYDIITKVHGGELRVETREGIGTNFIIILND